MQAFISYSQHDRPVVERLRRALLERDIEVWMPDTHIAPGHDIASGIEEAINDSDAIIVVISPSSAQSQWVSTETSFAIAQQRRSGKPLIIPVVSERTADVPFFLRNLNWVDLTGDQDFDGQVDRIAEAIQQSGSRMDDQDSADQARLQQLNLEKERLEIEKLMFNRKAQRTSRDVLIASATVGLATALASLAFVFFQQGHTSTILSGIVGFVAGVLVTMLVWRVTNAE